MVLASLTLPLVGGGLALGEGESPPPRRPRPLGTTIRVIDLGVDLVDVREGEQEEEEVKKG